jgi:hypothetical protein
MALKGQNKLSSGNGGRRAASRFVFFGPRPLRERYGENARLELLAYGVAGVLPPARAISED